MGKPSWRPGGSRILELSCTGWYRARAARRKRKLPRARVLNICGDIGYEPASRFAERRSEGSFRGSIESIVVVVRLGIASAMPIARRRESRFRRGFATQPSSAARCGYGAMLCTPCGRCGGTVDDDRRWPGAFHSLCPQGRRVALGDRAPRNEKAGSSRNRPPRLEVAARW